MTKTMMGLSAAALLVGSAFGAQAMPLPSVPEPAPIVEKVADGCGPGFFRGRFGNCRPMGYGPRFYGPRAYGPPVYGPRFYGPRPRPYYARPYRGW